IDRLDMSPAHLLGGRGRVAEANVKAEIAVAETPRINPQGASGINGTPVKPCAAIRVIVLIDRQDIPIASARIRLHSKLVETKLRKWEWWREEELKGWGMYAAPIGVNQGGPVEKHVRDAGIAQ